MQAEQWSAEQGGPGCRGYPRGPTPLGSSKELVTTGTVVWLCRARTHCAEHFHAL